MEHRPLDTTLYSLADAPPAQPERREGERHLSLFRVGSLNIGDRRELCLIKNISAGGMMIRAYCAIAEGTRLSVELKTNQPVSGTVRWIDGDTVGITFDEPVDVVELLTLSMEGPRPRMPRVEVGCLSWVRQGAYSRPARALDVSQGGAKLESDYELVMGQSLVVSLPGLPPQAATVRWRDGNCYGVTFSKVLPLAELVAWIQVQRAQLRAAS